VAGAVDSVVRDMKSRLDRLTSEQEYLREFLKHFALAPLQRKN
jgi:hypothetical protein